MDMEFPILQDQPTMQEWVNLVDTSIAEVARVTAAAMEETDGRTETLLTEVEKSLNDIRDQLQYLLRERRPSEFRML